MTIVQKSIATFIGLVALCAMAPFAFATTEYASAVHSSLQGTLKNGNAITDPNRTDPLDTLGAVDGAFYSLGFNGGNEANGGWIVLEYPTLMAGGDLTISPLEVTNGTYPLERTEVFVSSDAVTWQSIGFATNSGGAGPNPHGTVLPVSEQYCVKYVKLVDATDPNLHGATADAFDVDAVEANFTIECPGRVVVEKQTNPEGSGEPFSFTATWGGFSLKDNEQHDSGPLAAGTYAVTETIPSGWAQTNVTCSDGSDPSQISLQAGETVTCVFTNTQKGVITIEKQTTPADSQQQFEFNPSWSDVNFSLSDNQYQAFELLPGEYQVVELSLPGWNQTSVVCSSDHQDDQSTGGAINLSAGEHITCIFNNAMEEVPPPPCEHDNSCICGPVTVVTNNNATVSNTVVSKSKTGGNIAQGSKAGNGGAGGNGGALGGKGGNGGKGGSGGTGGTITSGNTTSVSTVQNTVNNTTVRIRR